MSNMKNGFSTLNRWFGKKNKTDKVTPNGKLSKSSTNLSSLSVSTTNINETSQLEYNRITPLPAATSNAPFEQTFRLTVLLPKDQLYVARLGARVPLSKLLELVCENKLLDSAKYEFRNPVDPSQVYSCDLTIGAVGLSEVRLCHKSEPYDSFNADEIIKLHRTAIIRDSLSSSEFSSRYSKHTAKTTSPYSSSNSLNSMDSTGMNCVRTPVSPPATLTASTPPPLKIAAPPRKKRAAPRPPSQIAIPEKTALGNDVADTPKKSNDSESNLPSLSNRYVSTPNLSTPTSTTTYVKRVDANGNSSSPTDDECVPKAEPEPDSNGYADEDIELDKSQVEQKNARNLCGGSVQNLSSPQALDRSVELPEPSPRKRLIQVKKKTVAPAPPQRHSMYADPDAISIRSINLCTPSSPDTPSTPLTLPSDGHDRLVAEPTQMSYENSPVSSKTQQTTAPTPPQTSEPHTDSTALQSSTPVLETSHTEAAHMSEVPASAEGAASVPKPLPRVTTTNNGPLNSSNTLDETSQSHLTTTNVSKIILNRSPTPEPRSLSAEPSDSDSYSATHIVALKDENDVTEEAPAKPNGTASYLGAHITALERKTPTEQDEDAVSKQADSGIGEPMPDSLPSEGSAHEGKSAFESSSDDDDIVKVYNFKLGKTVVKSAAEPQTLEDFALLSAAAQTDSGEVTPAPLTQEATPNFSDSASWNFSIPISPPPTFKSEKSPDMPITPKIREIPILSPPPNFADGRLANDFVSEKSPDMPITPKIKERPVLNFEPLTSHSLESHSPNEATSKSQLKQSATDKSEAALQSPTTPLHEIVDELSAIINEKRLDSLIKKADEQPKIEAAKPNTLSNFSITTITQQQQQQQHQQQTQERRADKPTPQPKSQEFAAPVASPKQTVNKQEPQTEAIEAATENSTKPANAAIPQNSTTTTSPEHSTSRRRSSGELSIGESPTLQSPEVIKTILNSRKNSSASSNSDAESKTGNRKRVSDSTQTKTEIQIPKSSNADDNTAQAKDAKALELNASAAAETAAITKTNKELPKVYRYSGPPSINFSTWNERPKAQVSIKNEGDYIFGGKNADSQSAAVTTAALEMSTHNAHGHNRGRTSMPANMFWAERANGPPPPVPAKPMSNGSVAKDYHVPITIRPLHIVPNENGCTASLPMPAKVSFRKATSVTKVLLNGAGDSQAQAEKFDGVQKRTHTSTLPRHNTNRFSMPVGPSVGATLLRSTSITHLEANKPNQPKQAHNETAAPARAPAPFGQNTLRKTGLKEKILAKEAESRQITANGDGATNGWHKQCNGYAVTNATKAEAANNFKNSITFNALQSSKFEQKPQNASSVYLNQASTISSSSANAAALPSICSPAASPTPSSSVNGAQLRNTPNGGAATTPTTPEPRDQLLLAIRNFKREDLNRV